MSRKKIECLHPTFIEHFPDRLEPGVLYVSMKYSMCVHTCACGCNQKVITPLSPKKWKLIYDGETVSLFPSIGNYAFPCRSHYYLTKNKVEWMASDDYCRYENNSKKHKRKLLEWFRRLFSLDT